MGHSTARAAPIHQHASADRDRLIADALSGLVEKDRTVNRPAKSARAAKGTKEDPQRKGHAGGHSDLIGAPGNDQGPGGGNIL